MEKDTRDWIFLVEIIVLLLLAGFVVGHKVGTWQFKTLFTQAKVQYDRAYEQGRHTGWLEMYNRLAVEEKEVKYKKL